MKELEGIVEVGLPSWACFFAPGLSKLPLGALEYTPAAPVQSTFGVCVCVGRAFLLQPTGGVAIGCSVSFFQHHEFGHGPLCFRFGEIGRARNMKES